MVWTQDVLFDCQYCIYGDLELYPYGFYSYQTWDWFVI